MKGKGKGRAAEGKRPSSRTEKRVFAASGAGAKISPARLAAFQILTLVGRNKGHSDELLHSAWTAQLSPEDRNLATALVMGTLRWQIALDARIAALLTRPRQRVPEPVALALRLGAFQLLHLDRVPAHAVLNDSVELCRFAGQPQATGMVNAILRKVAGVESQPDAGARARPLVESAAAMAERLGHPQWLVERWILNYGRKAALAICEYDQREPQPGAIFSPDAGPEAERRLPQIDDGSRLVAELTAAALPTTASTPRIWDACAAPGGKTLILASRHQQAEILATDVSPARLVQTTARFTGFDYAAKVRTEVADASVPLSGGGAFDLILCDVPCSGTGTLARNPEIRLRLRPEDLGRQAARQLAILRSGIRQLAPGGRLVYSTCSLEPEENDRVVEAVFGVTMGLRVVPVAPLLESLRGEGRLTADSDAALSGAVNASGALRTLPGIHPCDGFFAMVFERVS